MNSVRNRALAGVLALAPAAGLLVGSPALADPPALPRITAASVSQRTFVLGSTAGCRSFTLTDQLSAPMPTSGYDQVELTATLYAPGKSGEDTTEDIYLAPVGASGTATTYRGTLKMCGNYAPGGGWRLFCSGLGVPTGDTGHIKITNSIFVDLSLVRPSTLTFGASPKSVKKGKTFTAAGVLKSDGKTLPGAAVHLYFEAAGTKTYVLKANTVTNAKGAFSKKFTVSKSGSWKTVFAGSDTQSTVTAYQTVKVK